MIDEITKYILQEAKNRHGASLEGDILFVLFDLFDKVWYQILSLRSEYMKTKPPTKEVS